MKTIISKLFKEHDFKCIIENVFSNTDLYKPCSAEKTDFYLTYYINIDNTIDASNIKDIQIQFDLLQNNFKNSKNLLTEPLTDREKMQIDKNTTAIYFVKLPEMQSAAKIKNIIYALEESPYYFKKFVFIYTQNQVDEFKNFFNRISSIKDIMDIIINDSKMYEETLDTTYSDSIYTFTLRLFSKIPFTSYKFQNVSELSDISKSIHTKVNEYKMQPYYEFIKNSDANNNTLDSLLESINLTQEDYDNINIEINNLLDGEKL